MFLLRIYRASWTVRIAIGLALLVIARGATAADESKDEGFVSLFDGKTLAGWTGALESYGVEEGVIVCKMGSAGNLLTEKEYGDFVVQFEFRLSPGANNGLGIRCPKVAHGNLHLEGTELQILDDSAEKYRELKPYQYHGSVYGIVPAKRGALKPVGEWNSQEVSCKGRHIKVIVNGQTTVDADLDEASAKGTLDGQEHPGLKRTKGHLGFLGHGDKIEIRKIRIRDLSSSSGS